MTGEIEHRNVDALPGTLDRLEDPLVGPPSGREDHAGEFFPMEFYRTGSVGGRRAEVRRRPPLIGGPRVAPHPFPVLPVGHDANGICREDGVLVMGRLRGPTPIIGAELDDLIIEYPDLIVHDAVRIEPPYHSDVDERIFDDPQDLLAGRPPPRRLHMTLVQDNPDPDRRVRGGGPLQGLGQFP